MPQLAPVTIRQVEGRRDLRRFIDVPFDVHREHPLWVAPLRFERREFLDKRKNPYFEHAEAAYFLAERDGRAVGRITAQVDERWDEYQGGSDGMFGFYESIDDREVSDALLDAASEWVAGKGKQRILGPMDFTTNDEVGILIEGFDRPPMILQPWHPPSYAEMIEAHGYGKAMDLLMWELQFGDLKEGKAFDASIHAAAKKALDDEGITIRNMDLKDLPNEVRRFMSVYNEAWGDNWGFVPITDAEADHQAKALKMVMDEDWGMIAEHDGETIGAALTLPDINQVLSKLNGRLLPFGWARFLAGKRHIDQCRVFALGVKHDYHHTGVAAGLYLRHLENADRNEKRGRGIIGGEMGWILETNKPMNRAMEGMGGEIVKRYRIYEKSLA